MQVLFVGINELLYCETPRGQRRKSSPHWRVAVDRFETLMSALGDWIQVQTKPSKSRRRHIMATAYRYRRTTQFVAMSVLAMQAHATVSTKRETRFDTDSADIGIDNRCSACISHVESDFEGPLVHCNRVVKGFGGSRTRNIKMGTLQWSWEDDQGDATTFRIPNSYYVPDGGVRLLSPQHWAQTQQSKSSRFAKFDKRGRCEHPPASSQCGETTDSNRCVLHWNNGVDKRTVTLGRADNVATFTLASGYEHFRAFCCETDMIDVRLDDVIALPAGLISDDEDDDAPTAPLPAATPDVTPWVPTRLPASAADQATPVDFDLNGPPMTDSEGEGTQGSARSTSTTNVIIDEEDRQPSDLAELLMLHHQYGHISFAKLQEMAKQGIIPRRLSKCRVPVCSACLYSKMTRKPWRGKPSKKDDRETELPQRPGQVVSVDELVSPTPGLIAQMTGFLTTKRYKYATVYVDQFSRLGFIHLQKTASAEETIEGKKAFEAHARRHNVRFSTTMPTMASSRLTYGWRRAGRKSKG